MKSDIYHMTQSFKIIALLLFFLQPFFVNAGDEITILLFANGGNALPLGAAESVSGSNHWIYPKETIELGSLGLDADFKEVGDADSALHISQLGLPDVESSEFKFYEPRAGSIQVMYPMGATFLVDVFGVDDEQDLTLFKINKENPTLLERDLDFVSSHHDNLIPGGFLDFQFFRETLFSE